MNCFLNEIFVYVTDVGDGNAAVVGSDGVEMLFEVPRVAPEGRLGVGEHRVGQAGRHENELATGMLCTHLIDDRADIRLERLGRLTAVVHPESQHHKIRIIGIDPLLNLGDGLGGFLAADRSVRESDLLAVALA